jgi:ADP-heptose:LPS heptosyltransferase
MARRVLFVVRGKLGDTVIAYATVRAWIESFPADEVTLLVRASYAPLFAREAGLRVIGFGSRLAMLAKALAMRALEPAYDALLVLLGFGAPIRRLGRLVRARRKVYRDGRFASVYAEWPEIPGDHLQHEPAWRVAAVVAPDLAMPQSVRIASLAARRVPGGAIGIAPVSDETRRTLSPAVVHELADFLALRHPGRALHAFVNRRDRDAAPLLAAGLPRGTELREFPTIGSLVDELARLERFYTTDTGLYHLAVAMGVPTTVFYGPTQPWKNAMPAQPALTRVRLAALGGEHCEEKGCTSAACLNHAVRLHIGRTGKAIPEPGAPGCLLLRHPAEELNGLAIHEGPGR